MLRDGETQEVGTFAPNAKKKNWAQMMHWQSDTLVLFKMIIVLMTKWFESSLAAIF